MDKPKVLVDQKMMSPVLRMREEGGRKEQDRSVRGWIERRVREEVLDVSVPPGVHSRGDAVICVLVAKYVSPP